MEVWRSGELWRPVEATLRLGFRIRLLKRYLSTLSIVSTLSTNERVSILIRG